jgi:SAM-dependent methyltransferase
MDFSTIAGLAGGHAEARAIHVALELGVIEALSHRALRAEELAREIGCETRATMLLGNALTAMGLLQKEDGRYKLTEGSRRYLLESSPEYLGGMISFDASLWEVWGRLADSIRSGEPARRPDMFQTTPVETTRFIRAMNSLVRARGDAVWTAEHLDFSGVRTLVDLGGGPGTYLIEFLKRAPDARGAIYDLHATLEVAKKMIAEHDARLLPRVDFRDIDYNARDLPGPVDLIFMSNIIHSEDEGRNAALVTKCFRALKAGGRLVIKDHIMDDELVEPAAGAIFALYLLLTTYGRDYSLKEVSNWMTAAGFQQIEFKPLPNPPFTSSLVIARRQ